MFDHVMIGIDGEQGGRDAIALARQLASDEAQFTVAYVHGDYPITAKGSGLDSQFSAQQRTHAEELLASATNELGREASLAITGAPGVGQGLHILAEKNGADLLVVGSTRRGMFGRVFLGDDTRAALNGAPCAVAVAPGGYANRVKPLRRIGIAFNNSPESRHALTVARELGAYFGASLSACDVVVVPPFAYMGSGLVPVLDADPDELARSFGPGLLDDVDLQTASGFPGEELGFYSGSVDLLVVGSRGYGPIGRLIHGSTSQDLTRTARCPLLVLTRRGETLDEDGAGAGAEIAVEA